MLHRPGLTILRHLLVFVICCFYCQSLLAVAPTHADLTHAKSLLKTDAQESWLLFHSAMPYLEDMQPSIKLDWYELGVNAATNIRSMEKGWLTTKLFYDNAWAIANANQKLFIVQHFARLASISKQFDQALALFNCAEQFKDDTRHLLSISNNKGAVFIQTSQWEKAKAMYLKGIALSELHNYQNVIAAMSNNLGEVWIKLNEQDKALEAFKKAYVIKARIADETSQLSSLSNMMRVVHAKKDWQQWDKYYALYKRLLSEVGLTEFQAIHDWMLASKKLDITNVSPDKSELSALMQIVNNMQEPDNKAFINEVAAGMSVAKPFPEPGKPESTEYHNPDLDDVIKQCNLFIETRQ